MAGSNAALEPKNRTTQAANTSNRRSWNRSFTPRHVSLPASASSHPSDVGGARSCRVPPSRSDSSAGTVSTAATRNIVAGANQDLTAPITTAVSPLPMEAMRVLRPTRSLNAAVTIGVAATQDPIFDWWEVGAQVTRNGLSDRVPDARTTWLFREKLTRAGAIGPLFERF
jgi:hypothetical protein